MSNKSYNPFKMFGSYIGLGLAIIPVILLFYFVYAFEGAHGGYGLQPIRMLIFLGILIGGFLLGWGIHSLIRGLRR